jgi:hypothetical protein
VSSVTGGGVTWTLAARSNKTGGTTEVWQAYSTKKLDGIRVTAKLAAAYDGTITVGVFDGAAKRVGAVATGADRRGPATATLTTVGCQSRVWAVGHDWSAAREPVAATGQSIVHKFVDRRVSDTYWVQRVDAPVEAKQAVVVRTTGFTKDRWTLAAVEILGRS